MQYAMLSVWRLTRCPKPLDIIFPKLEIRKCEANQDSLSGRKLRLVHLNMSRSLRLVSIPKPLDIRFPKLEKKKFEVNGDSLSGSDWRLIGTIPLPERLSEVRDRRSPNPSENKNEKIK